MTELAKKIKGVCVSQGKKLGDLLEFVGLKRNTLHARFHNDDLWKLSELKKVAIFLEKPLVFFLE